ncbi:MAG: hypothetical protein AB8B79_07540 [Granulosicoccus sp.]
MNLTDFGSYFVGGEAYASTAIEQEWHDNVSKTLAEDLSSGSFVAGQACIQYFTPRLRNDFPPIVLVQSAGMSGTCWQNTPDQRKGWIHYLIERGFEVHVVESAHIGCSDVNRYGRTEYSTQRSAQEAWSFYRFGKAEHYAARRCFARQLFPIEHLENFARFFSPYSVNSKRQQTKTLIKLLEMLGKSIVIAHGEGADSSFEAACAVPDNLAGLLAIEPHTVSDRLEAMDKIPLVIVQGDYLDTDPEWVQRATQWKTIVRHFNRQQHRAQIVNLPTHVGPGNSHFPMMDKNNEACLDKALLPLVAFLTGSNSAHYN